jgi:hypothetical protein
VDTDSLPEFNVVDECWRQGEKDLSAMLVFPTSLEELMSLARYYWTGRFDLDMRSFLLTRCCS